MGDLHLVWTNHQSLSTEFVMLRHLPGGWFASGTAVAVFESDPALIHYEITLDPQWITQAVSVSINYRGGVRALTAAVDNGHWTISGVPHPEFDGCTDIDLGITPFTNTLPIRRLGLAVEESGPAAAVWVQFPNLNLEILRQTYTRLDRTTYEYRSASGFQAELTVDESGIVTRYGDLWTLAARYPAQ
jgi:hypothetical protein